MWRAVLLALLAAASCGRTPADPHGTLERVRGGELRAAIAAPAGEPSERAQRDLAAFARSIDASLVGRQGETHVLVEQLTAGEIDLIADLPHDTPFAPKVGLSITFGEGGRKRVWAVRPGENAMLMAVDRFLAAEVRP